MLTPTVWVVRPPGPPLLDNLDATTRPWKLYFLFFSPRNYDVMQDTHHSDWHNLKAVFFCDLINLAIVRLTPTTRRAPARPLATATSCLLDSLNLLYSLSWTGMISLQKFSQFLVISEQDLPVACNSPQSFRFHSCPPSPSSPSPSFSPTSAASHSSRYVWNSDTAIILNTSANTFTPNYHHLTMQ